MRPLFSQRILRNVLLIAVITRGGLLAAGPAPGVVTEQESSPPAIEGVVMTVAVAASAAPAFEEIARAFSESRDVRINISTGPTGQLKRQAEKGAEFDVFAGSDMARILDLAAGGIVDGASVRPYAAGRIVLWLPEGQGPLPGELEDLAKPPFENWRLAVANPELAPYGIAAREALTASGILDAVQERLVIGSHTQDALETAVEGNAEAAIVSRSLASRKGGTMLEIDTDLYSPILQGIGVLAGARNAETAQEFVDFVVGSEGQAILGSHGFASPGIPSEAVASE